MILGVIADDFTGASDVAAMLSRGGMRTELLIGVPEPGASAAQAGVIALKSRSIPAIEAVLQSLAAFQWLEAQGCRQFLFKYCSTFDSTPAGNIGPVAEALAERLGAKGVVVCPALPENGRTVYFGHLFVKGRLLNESGMEHHPLNPMTDPDIRRWLARQCRGEVGLVDESIVAAGPEKLRQALAERRETLVVVDAISDADLLSIGEAAADAPLITGGSGVAMGLPQNYRRRGLPLGGQTAFAGTAGPAVVLSGSCSPATRAQVAAFRANHPAAEIDVDGLMAGAPVEDALVAFAASHRRDAPIIFSSADPDRVADAQQRHGRERVSAALDALFGSLARRLVEEGATKLVVAGGETSGAVVSALDARQFEIGPEIAPGVPVLVARRRERPLALALKSGNFGQLDFFERALAVLGTKANDH
jgi:uncharacterized protein YgbK (DUF1537 family)